jgi:5-methylthioadenosine/S-adenosylhomocysteine deaminase
MSRTLLRGADVITMAAGRPDVESLDLHLHTWQTALRFMGVDWSLLEYLGNVHGGDVVAVHQLRSRATAPGSIC